MPAMRARVVLGIALVLTLGACPALSPYVHGPFLVNHSGESLALTVEWLALDAPELCEVPLAELAAELPERVEATYSLTLDPTLTAKLGAPPGEDGSNIGRCPSAADRRVGADAMASRMACVVLRIQGDDLPPYLVRADAYWESDDTETRCRIRVPVYEDPGQGAVVITHGGSERSLRAHAHTEAMKL
jgi:hypothetical protein